MKPRLFILMLILIAVGCEKEPDPPIVEPGPYFPVYPGSWWKYQVNNSTFVTEITSNDYVYHSFKIAGDPEKWSDPARVPTLNGLPIYHYEFPEEIGYPSTIHQGIYELWPILSENVGFRFKCYWSDPRNPYPTELVTVKGKEFDGEDSLLRLESGWTNSYMSGYLLDEKRYRVYIREIGLYSDITVDTVTGDTLSKKILIDYFINHPFE